jgi:hypothetical protein
MEAVYLHLDKGTNQHEALPKAQLENLQSSRKNHPFFWGTFILIGDDRPIPLAESTFGRWMLLLGLLIGVVGLGWWLQYRQRQLKIA